MAAHHELRSIDTKDLAVLLSGSGLPRQALRFWTGQRIFAEGNPCDGVFVVRSGRIELSCNGAQHNAVRIRIAGPNEVVGLVSAMNQAPYSKTAVVLEESVLDRLLAEDVRCFLYASPDRYMKVLNFLCADADAMQHLLAEIKTAKRRVARASGGDPRKTEAVTIRDTAKREQQDSLVNRPPTSARKRRRIRKTIRR